MVWQWVGHLVCVGWVAGECFLVRSIFVAGIVWWFAADRSLSLKFYCGAGSSYMQHRQAAACMLTECDIIVHLASLPQTVVLASVITHHLTLQSRAKQAGY